MLKTIKVLYEDKECVVFDKPAGLLVIPTPKNETKTLNTIVNRHYTMGENTPRLHPCHRLDRDTSGVILFAKGKRNQQRMTEQFKKNHVTKKYIAFVHGRVKKNEGEFKSKIKDLDQKKFSSRAPGKLAVTRYRVLDRYRNFSVVEILTLTGRTNQIRIQFSQAGYPLVGDRKYAIVRRFPLKFRRSALHAQTLTWINPLTGKKITVQSPLPNDMEAFIGKHRN